MSAIVSKGEFATLSQVTPTRVGQWIREGKLTGPALVGEGRFAKINVEVARRQLADRRDIGQAMGNGAATRLTPTPQPDADDLGDPVAEALKQERLTQLRYQNAKAAEDAFARRGLYVRADATAAAMTRVAAKMLTVFEASLTELASELAQAAGLERREVLHKLRAAWRDVRAKAAEAARREAAELPPLTEDLVPDATDPALGEA